jgi:GntR family transcriptional repressor for pyruvate dehydrogenase complex
VGISSPRAIARRDAPPDDCSKTLIGDNCGIFRTRPPFSLHTGFALGAVAPVEDGRDFGGHAALVSRKRFEEIAEHLELMIVSGKLKVGDRIPSERALMDTFGTGRPSVREAIFSLQKKGLLTATPGNIPRVQSPDAKSMLKEMTSAVQQYLRRPHGMRNLQQARSLLESGLARTAARVATKEDIRRLEAALRRNERAKSTEAFVAADMEFHSTIAGISGNDIFTALNQSMAEWLAEQRRVSASSGVSAEEVLQQHRRIFEAIAARNEEGAWTAMEDHLAAVARNYWLGMGVTPGEPVRAPADWE